MSSTTEREPDFNSQIDDAAPKDSWFNRAARTEVGGRILEFAKGVGGAAVRGALSEGLGVTQTSPEGRTELRLAGFAEVAGKLLVGAETGTFGATIKGLAVEAAQGARVAAVPEAQAHVQDAATAATEYISNRLADFAGGTEASGPAPESTAPVPEAPMPAPEAPAPLVEAA